MPPVDVAPAPAPATTRALDARTRLAALPWPLLALIALSIAVLVGALLYPTYPNYDSYYSLLWGRDILHGHKPDFDVYKTPTEHPLAIAFSMVLSLIGRHGDRVMVLCTEASFVVLCAGLYRLGKVLFTPLVGLAAAAILCTRFDFPFLAARAYIDIPYLAFVIWAAALEVARPRRGGVVWALLVCAGMLRPEAWIMLGLYFLWMAVAVPAGERVRRWGTMAAIAAIAPLVWVALDTAVTGHPLFSLQHTSGLADELGRTKGLSQVPGAMQHFFLNLAKAPVIDAAIAGVLVSAFIAPRRTVFPAVLWVIGSGTFVLVGIGGFSVIDRYLLVPTLMVMLFAAVLLAGWTMLTPGTLLRRGWAVAALAVVVYGVIFTATRVNFTTFDNNLRLRGESHRALVKLLDQPKVRAAIARCGPVATPNHKLVPDSRWILGASATGVIARSDPGLAKLKRAPGVQVFVTNRAALLLQALVDSTDDPFDSIPSAGFAPVGFSSYYSAFARC